MPRLSRVVAVGALTALAAATALPAAAQSVEQDAAADATAGVVRLTAPGTEVLTVGESSASLRDAGATASAVPLSLAGQAVGAQAAESTGSAVRAPAEGDGCQAPVDQLAGVVTVELVCGVASADLGGGTAAATSGIAGASALSLDLSAGHLGQLETVILQDLGLAAQLDESVGAALRGLVDPLADECEVSLSGLVSEVPGLGDLPIDAITGPLDDVIAEITGEVPVVCELLQTVVDVLAGEDGVLPTGSLAGVLDGSAGVIEATLLETASDVAADGTTVTADARPTGAASLSLNLPLGDALRDGLDDVLTSLTEGLLGQLGTPLFDELGLDPDDPAGDLAAQVLGAEGVSGVIASDQLLSLQVTPGRSAVSVAQSTGGADEVVAEPAIVGLGGSLLDLPPLQALEDAVGDGLATLDASLLEVLRGTPLSDILAVTLLDAETDTDATVGGLPGATARSGAATVQLFAIADGGVRLELSPATAAAGAAEVDLPTDTPEAPAPDPQPEPVPDEPDPLPRTGGGLALLGVLAMAGAAGLRRR